MLHEFWVNFTTTCSPLLLFFCFGFLIPIFKVRSEFPMCSGQGLTSEPAAGHRLARRRRTRQDHRPTLGANVGFMVVGFA